MPFESWCRSLLLFVCDCFKHYLTFPLIADSYTSTLGLTGLLNRRFKTLMLMRICMKIWTTTKCMYACSGHRTKWSPPSERKVHGSGNSHHHCQRRQRQRPHVFQNFVFRQHQRELSRRYPTTTEPRPTDHRYRHWRGNCKMIHWLTLNRFYFLLLLVHVWGVGRGV